MSELPQAIWSGSFNLFGVDVKCHTLSDGQRVIEGESFAALMDAMGQPGVVYAQELDLTAFETWRRGEARP